MDPRFSRKISWSREEDDQLVKAVSDFKPEKDGRIRWKAIASQIQNRNAKQVRERWLNHLRPDMKKGDWTEEEELILFELQGSMGNKWKAISEILQRSDNDVKNRWNSKGYSRCLKEFSDNSLNETRAMLIETPKAMTDGEPSTLAKSLTSVQSIPPDTCETLQISDNNFKPNILRTSRSLKRIAPFEGSRSLTSEKYPKVPVEIQPAITPGVEHLEYHRSKTILPFQEHSDESNASSSIQNTSPMEISQAEVGIGLRSFCSPDLHYTSSPFQSDELSSLFVSYGRNPATDVTQELSPATMSSEKASDTPLPFNSEPHFSANSYDFLGRTFFSPGIRTPASENDMISPIGHLYNL